MAEEIENVQAASDTQSALAEALPPAKPVGRGRRFTPPTVRVKAVTEAQAEETRRQEEQAEALVEQVVKQEHDEREAARAKSAAEISAAHQENERIRMLNLMTPEERAKYRYEQAAKAPPLFEAVPLPEGATEAEKETELTRRAALQFVHDADEAGRTVLEHAAVEAGVKLPDSVDKSNNAQIYPQSPRMVGESLDEIKPYGANAMDDSSTDFRPSKQNFGGSGPGGMQKEQQEQQVQGNLDFNDQAIERLQLEEESAFAALEEEFKAEQSRLQNIIANGTPEEQASAQAELKAREQQYAIAVQALTSLFSQRSVYREAMMNERTEKMVQPNNNGGGTGRRSLLDSLRKKQGLQDKYLKFSEKMPTEKDRVMQTFRANSAAAALRYNNVIQDTNHLQAATEKVRALTEQSTREFLKTEMGAELDKNLQKLTARSMSVEDSRDPEKFTAKHADIIAQFAGYKPVDPDIAASMKGLKVNHAYNLEHSTDPDILNIKERSKDIQKAANDALLAQERLQNGLQSIKDSGDTSFDAEPLRKKIEANITPNLNEKPFDPADTKGELAKKTQKLAESTQRMIEQLMAAIMRLFGLRSSPSDAYSSEAYISPSAEASVEPAMSM